MSIALSSSPRRVRLGVVTPALLLVSAGWVVLAVARDHASVPSFTAMWGAMTVAMMLPTVARPMARAAQRGVRGAWLFAGGFVVAWAAAGAPTYVVLNAVEWTPTWIATAWLVAGIYQLTPVMQRNLTTCRSVPYAHDPMRYGVRQGVRCVVSCLPVMVAAMVTAMALPGTVLPMLGLLAVTALLCWEKSPGTRPRSIASVGLAIILVSAAGAVLVGGTGGVSHHASGTSTS